MEIHGNPRKPAKIHEEGLKPASNPHPFPRLVALRVSGRSVRPSGAARLPFSLLQMRYLKKARGFLMQEKQTFVSKTHLFRKECAGPPARPHYFRVTMRYLKKTHRFLKQENKTFVFKNTKNALAPQRLQHFRVTMRYIKMRSVFDAKKKNICFTKRFKKCSSRAPSPL